MSSAGTQRQRTIVVGVDGSEGSEQALRWTADHARATGGTVVAVHAYSTPHVYAPVGAPEAGLDLSGWRKEAQRAFETEWTVTLEGIDHRTVMRDGPAARTLLDIAAEEGADLIVVGSRGRGGFSELLLGSVSHHVSHHADRPVVIIPRDGGRL